MQNIKTFFRMYRQLQEILNKKERTQKTVIAILSVISALAETLGVGVILPFIIAMLQPQSLLAYPRIKAIFDLLNIHSDTEIVVCVGIGVVLVYIAKNGFIIFFNRYKLFFRNSLERDLSIRMMKSYMDSPYSFFINVNSSEIMRGVLSDNSAVAEVVDDYCALINEGLTCVMLGIALILINPVMALSIVVLAGSLALVIVISLRKKIGECSIKAREAFADRYRYTYESINGIKEIAVMKRQDRFLKRFTGAATKAAYNNTRYMWMAMLPSRLIETIFIVGLVVIVSVSYGLSDNISVMTAQLSALGVAAIRILPSVSNVSSAMNSLVFQRPAFENAHENITNDYKRLKEDSHREKEYRISTKSRSFLDEIAIRDIHWRYEGTKQDVINGLSLDIKKGEAVGIVGESGAGKTTLIDILLGLYVPKSGSVTVDGHSIFDADTGWHNMVGYVPQTIFLMDDTIRNNIRFGVEPDDADEERLKKVLDQAQLTEYVSKQPQGLDTVLGEQGIKLSGGQRQRIAIARALYQDPDILVLDEATSALDNDTEAAVIEAINALHGEKTLIIVAHRLTTIDKCDRVYEIKDGQAVTVR